MACCVVVRKAPGESDVAEGRVVGSWFAVFGDEVVGELFRVVAGLVSDLLRFGEAQ